jgi:predicted esterase
MKNKALISLAIFYVVISTNILSAQQTEQKFVKEVNYLLSLPDGYNTDTIEKWPVIVFLHGSGERGDDLEKVKVHGPPKLINAGQKMPFIVVSPQVARADQWWYSDLLMLMIKGIIKKYRVDESRIYLTGLSMGGYGTWDIALKYPELFAAIAPICGAGDPSEVWKIRHTPVWIFHGEKDPAVPVKNSKTMYAALLQYGNARLTIYPDAAHDCWTETYNNPELYKWFLSHKRFTFEEGAMPEKPEKFTGTYVSQYDTASVFYDSVRVYQKEGKLYAKIKSNRNREQQIFPFRDDSFYFNKTSQAEIKFNTGKKGKIDSFIYYKSSYVYKTKLNFRRVK